MHNFTISILSNDKFLHFIHYHDFLPQQPVSLPEVELSLQFSKLNICKPRVSCFFLHYFTLSYFLTLLFCFVLWSCFYVYLVFFSTLYFNAICLNTLRWILIRFLSWSLFRVTTPSGIVSNWFACPWFLLFRWCSFKFHLFFFTWCCFRIIWSLSYIIIWVVSSCTFGIG